MKAASISDYRNLARRRLPRSLFDYNDGGSYNETTLAANQDDLRRIALDQRVLRGVSAIANRSINESGYGPHRRHGIAQIGRSIIVDPRGGWGGLSENA